VTPYPFRRRAYWYIKTIPIVDKPTIGWRATSIVVSALLISTNTISAQCAPAIQQPSLKISDMAKRKDWLSKLPDTIGSIEKCYASMLPTEHKARVFSDTKNDDESLSILFVLGSGHTMRQFNCNVRPIDPLTNGSSSTELDRSDFLPVAPPFFTKELPKADFDPGLTVRAITDMRGIELGYVLFH
jgi:hypothetical protein